LVLARVLVGLPPAPTPDPWKSTMHLMATAPIPGEGSELALYRRGVDYFIKIVGGQDLMNSRAHGSEDALGVIACNGLRGKPAARVLIGGLGMGFTLSAALSALDDDAEVVVAEIVPGVVEWNRGELGEVAGMPLDDPRTRVHEVDVTVLLQKEPAGYDAIVLDVDNGPDGLTRASNEWLYSRAGLSVTFRALRPGGALAIWSAAPDRAVTKRLRSAGFVVEEVTVRAHAGKGARHVIWMARRVPAP
jgi:spermidine synthase